MSAIRPVVRNAAFRNFVRRYHEHGDFKAPSMNDLPVPQGSWKTHYDAQNAKYTRHLVLGVAFTAVTLVTAKASGLVYLNYAPPSSLE